MITEEIKVTFSEPEYKPYFDDDKESRNVYKVTVSYNGKKTSFTFGDSIHNTENGIDPKANDILEIITTDFYYTPDYYPDYESFAGEFGYDQDSRKGEAIYKRCLKQGEKLHKLFTDDDIEQIRKELDI